MQEKHNGAIASGLIFAIILWGGSNAGGQHLVANWPAIFAGSTRFLAAGMLLLALTRWTSWFGPLQSISRTIRAKIWRTAGLTLAIYIVAFYWSMKFTSVAHVALYLGASPVWALLWEGVPERNWRSVQRYAAATLALAGVLILFWPSLGKEPSRWLGEFLGLACSVLWTLYGRQCRELSSHLNPAALTGHTMWRAGVLLLPFVLLELSTQKILWRADLVWVQLYCIVGGGVIPFGLWNTALRHWPTSKVYLFNNLVPISTMTWTHLLFGNPITANYWMAMSLILAAVFLGQVDWKKVWKAGRRLAS